MPTLPRFSMLVQSTDEKHTIHKEHSVNTDPLITVTTIEGWEMCINPHIVDYIAANKSRKKQCEVYNSGCKTPIILVHSADEMRNRIWGRTMTSQKPIVRLLVSKNGGFTVHCNCQKNSSEVTIFSHNLKQAMANGEFLATHPDVCNDSHLLVDMLRQGTIYSWRIKRTTSKEVQHEVR